MSEVELVAKNLQDYRVEQLETGRIAQANQGRSRKNRSRIDDLREKYTSTEVAQQAQIDMLLLRVNKLELAKAADDKRYADMKHELGLLQGIDQGRAEVTGRQDVTALRQELTKDRADERRTTREWIGVVLKFLGIIATLATLAGLLARAILGE